MGSSKSDVWMPVYIGDLLADTQHLTDEQFGKYHKLLYHQWRSGHFSEDEILAICGFAGPALDSASSTSQVELKQVFSRVLAPIKKMLSKDASGLWFSRRCDFEKQKWSDKKRVFTERAKKGGIAKARRRREELAKNQDKNSASSSASAVLEGVLESCTSPVPIKAISPLPPFRKRNGGDAPAVANISPGAAPEASAVSGRADLAASNSRGKRVVRKSVAPGTINGVGGHKPVIPRVGEISVFRDEVQAYWRAQNPGIKVFPWGPPDERALAALVASCSGLDLEGFRRLLRNRGASEVMSSALPRRWLRSLMEFAGGPLDRAHKAARGARSL